MAVEVVVEVGAEMAVVVGVTTAAVVTGAVVARAVEWRGWWLGQGRRRSSDGGGLLVV